MDAPWPVCLPGDGDSLDRSCGPTGRWYLCIDPTSIRRVHNSVLASCCRPRITGFCSNTAERASCYVLLRQRSTLSVHIPGDEPGLAVPQESEVHFRI